MKYIPSNEMIGFDIFYTFVPLRFKQTANIYIVFDFILE
jgi:hypothetical protein